MTDGRGHYVPASRGWDQARGRRSLVLWFAATPLFAAGALAAFWTPAGVLPVFASAVLYLVSRRHRRLAMGLSRSEMTLLGPIGGHPLGYTRRYEPGTWWARWAWVDLALSIGTLALLAVHPQG